MYLVLSKSLSKQCEYVKEFDVLPSADVVDPTLRINLDVDTLSLWFPVSLQMQYSNFGPKFPNRNLGTLQSLPFLL